MSPLQGLVITKAALSNLASIPLKIRLQIIKKSKALILDPHPSRSKKLGGVTTEDGEPIYRQRSGDYRILYIVRRNPSEVIVLDIDNRKDVYRMTPKDTKKTDKADYEYRMKAKDFDKAMRRALGTPAPSKPTRKRRSSKKKGKG